VKLSTRVGYTGRTDTKEEGFDTDVCGDSLIPASEWTVYLLPRER
jgi:hypothetical protein